MFKVIIAGSRGFGRHHLFGPHKKIMDEKMRAFLSKKVKEDVEIVSGCARGADDMGIQWAHANAYQIKKFPAKWDTLGKKAGIIRNHEMGDYADALVAFWDGSSTGTKDMIDYMLSLGKPVRVIKFDPTIQGRRYQKISRRMATHEQTT